MEGFTEYESKPVTRMAYRVKPADAIQGLTESTYVIKVGGKSVVFKAYETVFPGDYIINNADDDMYHCRQATFLDRNIV